MLLWEQQYRLGNYSIAMETIIALSSELRYHLGNYSITLRTKYYLESYDITLGATICYSISYPIALQATVSPWKFENSIYEQK